jgi:hypothetical protein
MCDCPEEKKDGEGAHQCRHAVDHQRHTGGIACELGEKVPYKHEKWSTGGVTHFELVGRGDEFTTVPETGRGLNGEQVNHGSNGKHDPSCNVVD